MNYFFKKILFSMNFCGYKYHNLFTFFNILLIKSKTLKQIYNPTLNTEIAVCSMIKKKNLNAK